VRLSYMSGTPGADANTYNVVNSTLLGGANFFSHTGTRRVMVTIKNSHAGTLKEYRSTDKGATWTQISETAVAAPAASASNTYKYHVSQFNDWKLDWVNGGSAQTTFTVDISLLSHVAVTTETMRTSGTNNTVTLTTSSSAQITIHWGDGTTTDKTGASQVSAHTYADGIAGHSIWIEHGETLTLLQCNGNQLVSLTIPPEWALLQNLQCHNNQLVSLTLSGLRSLQSLYCYSNQLVSLTIPPELTALVIISCASNKLVSLALPPESTALQTVYCYSNQLTSLTIPPELTALQTLYCFSNGWSESVVDDVLVDLLATVIANPRGGTLQIHGTNSTPSGGTGCPAYCALVNTYSWACTISGSCSCDAIDAIVALGPEISCFAGLHGDVDITGDPATQWDDVSGNANHLTDPGADSRPDVTTAGSDTILSFDGDNDSMVVPSAWASLATSATVVVAFKLTDTPTATDKIFTVDDWNFCIHVTSTTLSFFTGSANYGDYSHSLGTDWHVLVMRYDGAGVANSDRMRVWLDGSEITLSFTGTIVAQLASATAAGLGASVVGADGAPIDVGAFVAFDTALSVAEIDNVNDYIDITIDGISL
jgi:hypothetical protein